MSFELSFFHNDLMQRQSVQEVIKCNEQTARFGLVLTEQQAFALVKTRSTALKENGRIEFLGGVIDKIITEFCDSPYLTKQNYEETLHGLLEIFYDYKNQTLDLISDDDLIHSMKNAFDGTCQGSLDLLSGRELSRLARNLRYGYAADYSDEDEDKEEDEDENGED